MWSALALVLLTNITAGELEPRPQDRFEVEPARFDFRRGSLAFGGRGFTNFSPCRLGGRLPDGCGVSPMLAVTGHVGWRRLSFIGELSTSPVPRIDFDYIVLDIARVGLGVSVGNAAVRGSLVGFGGYISGGAEARLTVVPWVDRRARRHGFELSAGWSMFFGEVTIAYRFIPARWGRSSR